VADHLSDEEVRHSGRAQATGKGVAEIVDPEVLDPGVFQSLFPGVPDVVPWFRGLAHVWEDKRGEMRAGFLAPMQAFSFTSGCQRNVPDSQSSKEEISVNLISSLQVSTGPISLTDTHANPSVSRTRPTTIRENRRRWKGLIPRDTQAACRFNCLASNSTFLPNG
jgi:hypothetical protein